MVFSNAFLSAEKLLADEIVEGAEVNAKDKNGDTPLDLAKSKGNEELVDLLRKRGGVSKRK